MTQRWMRTFVAAALGLALLLPGGGVARADSWQDRVTAGSTAATARGTTIEIAMLDRVTGQYRDNGRAAHTRIESASVMKVFIAEHLLHRRDLGQIRLSATDMGDMARMLRESLDAPASRFWGRFGANAIVQDVIRRYGLTETRVTSNVRYWGNTLITAHDMVVFYDRMLDGSAGLSAGSRDWIVEQLRRSTVQGDGGRQFFGLRDGLPREQVIAQKQGWMCCVNGNIYRHSTGLTGPDSRFVVVVLTREPSGQGGAHIEESLTGAVRAMFPEGLVPRVQGAIGEHWYQLGGASGRLGYPTSDEIGLPGGAVHFFQGGSVYWSPATGARAVRGDILAAYGAQGWENGRLRYPTSDEVALPDGGLMNRFQGGSVYWSSRTGAHWVIGSIHAAYKAQGYQRGALGYPRTDEVKLPGGAVTHFEGGSVFWSPGRGAHALTGGLHAAYKAQDYHRGPLGFPVSDAYAVAGGRRMDFQGGSLTVPTTPAAVTPAPVPPGPATVPSPEVPAPAAPTGEEREAPVAPPTAEVLDGDAQP